MKLPKKMKDAKVLIMGLGTLGGGVATTRWFLERASGPKGRTARRGADVTVTDLRSRAELASSVKALGKDARKVRFVLGRHDPEDFKTHDLVVVNPAVPRTSPFLKVARKAGKRIANDASIFFDEVRNPVVAVTGTRGKTTTANWIAHLLRVRAGGNSSSDLPLLKFLGFLKPREIAVVELSSWQLELLNKGRRKPNIAVITNLHRDHLNRYRGMADYARAKANIFKRQTKNQKLILNADNEWTGFLLKQFAKWRTKSKVYLFSLMPLPKSRDGLFVNCRAVYFQEHGRARVVLPRKLYERCETFGSHNLENLLAALLAAHLAARSDSSKTRRGASWKTLARRVRSLPQIPLRQEIVLREKRLMVVNDSAGTSPDATIAALRRFSGNRTFLLAGGTDKKLDFKEWAAVVARHVPPADLLLLEGNATKKMIAALRRIGYLRATKPNVFASLPQMLRSARAKLSSRGGSAFSGKTENRKPKTVVLFSPGAASFEKFRNEFDRGKKFNLYCRKVFKNSSR